MKRQMRLAAPGNLQKITGRNPGGARKLLMGGSVPGGRGVCCSAAELGKLSQAMVLDLAWLGLSQVEHLTGTCRALSGPQRAQTTNHH